MLTNSKSASRPVLQILIALWMIGSSLWFIGSVLPIISPLTRGIVHRLWP